MPWLKLTSEKGANFKSLQFDIKQWLKLFPDFTSKQNPNTERFKWLNGFNILFYQLLYMEKNQLTLNLKHNLKNYSNLFLMIVTNRKGSYSDRPKYQIHQQIFRICDFTSPRAFTFRGTNTLKCLRICNNLTYL